MQKTDPPIKVELFFPCNLKNLWSALTAKEEMVQWFFDNIPEFKAEVDFSTEFPVKSENRIFTHCWKVIEANPMRKIKYQWYYKEYEGNATVCFEIEKQNKGCQLIFTMNILEDFTPNVDEFKRESCKAGWDYFLGDRLQQYITTKYHDQ